MTKLSDNKLIWHTPDLTLCEFVLEFGISNLPAYGVLPLFKSKGLLCIM
jgi:hypothetical protein